jgi:hypothetical protein
MQSTINEICNVAWTADVVAAYQAAQAESVGA